MFKCNECGFLFEEAKVIEEHHPYGMGYATEEWYVCPHCGDSHIGEAEQCTRCGEYTTVPMPGVGGCTLCEICHEDLYG